MRGCVRRDSLWRRRRRRRRSVRLSPRVQSPAHPPGGMGQQLHRVHGSGTPHSVVGVSTQKVLAEEKNKENRQPKRQGKGWELGHGRDGTPLCMTEHSQQVRATTAHWPLGHFTDSPAPETRRGRHHPRPKIYNAVLKGPTLRAPPEREIFTACARGTGHRLAVC